MGTLPKTLIVIPCYNEAKRLDAAQLAQFFDQPNLDVLFVNDGSTDATATTLARFCETSQARASWLSLQRNVGKAEAVRAGLLKAVSEAYDVVGYADADLATPVQEVARLRDVLVETGAGVVIGARIAYRGADIERSLIRHYLGRVFATCASVALDQRIYDTQCGAKLFRVGPALREALVEPFQSRWVFDVELLGRLFARQQEIREVPLLAWRDVQGSTLKPSAMVRAILDLGRLAWQLRRQRLALERASTAEK